MDITVKLHEFGYLPITHDNVYKNVSLATASVASVFKIQEI